ncbi:hypothetical protein LP420_15285 [Massilia sp. B-10]|nr:hypothetical protein LP420_15285 [Massilia sp. B-10]
MQGKAAPDPAWCFVDEQGVTLLPDDYPVMRVCRSRRPLASADAGRAAAGAARTRVAAGARLSRIRRRRRAQAGGGQLRRHLAAQGSRRKIHHLAFSIP